eukprot:14694531-Ditylum_brightwellii.AAC.1
MKQAKEKRENENQKLASIYTLTGKVEKEKVLKSIVTAEKMSQIWKKIQFTDKKQTKGSIIFLQILSSWPQTTNDMSLVLSFESPKKATEWRT